MTDFNRGLGSDQTVFEAELRMKRGDLAGAMVAVRQMLGENPELGPRWGNVVWLAESLGDYDAALQAARRYFMVDPLNPVAGLKVAELLGETGRTEQALEVSENFADQRPGDPAPQYYVGLFNGRRGEFDLAIERFRRALEFKPDLTPAWEQIAALKTFTTADPDIAVMEALNNRLLSADTVTRAPLLYALAKAMDDVGDTDRAFSFYAEGARLMGAERPWNGRAFEALVDEVVRSFDQKLMTAQRSSAVQSDRAVFVVGAPRSGAALVEQILTNCPGVRGGGSLNLFRLASLPLTDHRPSRIEAYAAASEKAGTPDFWTSFGGNYLAFLDERFGFEGRIIDRTLNHMNFLGSLKLAAPKSPILWVRRDPYDVAWSCFRTRFQRGQDWAWSLRDIAQHLHQLDRLHAHWSEVLGEALHTVEYEALVQAPEAGITALTQAAGLPDAPEAHAFHTNPRAIDTASLVDVRRPMSAKSIGAWRRYERQIEPFVSAYEKLKG